MMKFPVPFCRHQLSATILLLFIIIIVLYLFHYDSQRDNRSEQRKSLLLHHSSAHDSILTDDVSNHDNKSSSSSSSSSRLLRSLQGKIVGGVDVTKGEFPSFGYSVGFYLCGGTLIYYDMFLTAGHCHGAYKPGLLFSPSVKLGATSLNRSDGFKVGIDAIIPHPNFATFPIVNNDILLVKLSTPVFNIPLQKLNFNPAIPAVNDVLTAIGVGTTSYRGSLSSRLLKVSINTLDNTNCSSYWESRSFGSFDTNTHICAGNLQGGKDTCQGDSGGPLFSKADGSEVGITSFGYRCATTNSYPVYTRISTYQEFITSTVCGFSDAINDTAPFNCTGYPRLTKTCSCRSWQLLCRWKYGCLFRNFN